MEEGWDRLIHEGVGLDEVKREIRKRAGVVNALAGPRVGHFHRHHRQPIRVRRLLLLKGPFERVGNVLEREGTHGGAGDAVGCRREHPVHHLRRRRPVVPFNQLSH